jgi:hypothetical protein
VGPFYADKCIGVTKKSCIKKYIQTRYAYVMLKGTPFHGALLKFFEMVRMWKNIQIVDVIGTQIMYN